MITFNGFDLSDDIRVTDISRPLNAPSLLTSSTIVGRDGAFLYYKTAGPQNIDVSFMLIDNDQKSLRMKVRDLSEKLDTDKPEKLIFSDEPDKYINAIVEDSIELNEVAAIASGSISFFCPDPYWYAIEDDIIEKDTHGIYEFERKGTAKSYPLIEIEGSNKKGSIIIENRSSDEKIEFDGVLKTGEKLVLDSDSLTAYIVKPDGSTSSAIDNLSTLDFPVLDKGKNFLAVMIKGDASISKVKISCRSRWK